MGEIFFSVPYILRVILSLFFILLINRIVKELSISVIGGILLLAFWTGHDYNSILSIGWKKISDRNTVFLLVIIFQVIALSQQMSLTGSMKELVSRIQKVVSKRTSMALLPALIGFLPMPGGAIFSAPMVADCDLEKEVYPLLKTKINYWFRHVWEYWWPLYPGVLLAVELSGLPIMTFMVLQLPLSIASIWAGYFFLLRKVDYTRERNYEILELKPIIILLMPIIIIITIYGIISILLPAVVQFNRYMPMICGIFIAQVFLQIVRPLSLKSWIPVIANMKSVNLMILVGLILFYGSLMSAKLPDGPVLINVMQSELASWGIPVILIIVIIPFMSGFTTGLAVGFVGASFPIVMSLVHDPSQSELMATTVLAFGSGYVGMILSPVHICLVVTSDHFNTVVSDSLIRLIKPGAIVFVAASLMYLFLMV